MQPCSAAPALTCPVIHQRTFGSNYHFVYADTSPFPGSCDSPLCAQSSGRVSSFMGCNHACTHRWSTLGPRLRLSIPQTQHNAPHRSLIYKNSSQTFPVSPTPFTAAQHHLQQQRRSNRLFCAPCQMRVCSVDAYACINKFGCIRRGAT